MQELAIALRVDSSAATRTVDRLVRSGLAERSHHDKDGRVVVVMLTNAGERTLVSVGGRQRQVLNRVLSGFGSVELEELVSLLERLVSSVDRELSSASRSLEWSDAPD